MTIRLTTYIDAIRNGLAMSEQVIHLDEETFLLLQQTACRLKIDFDTTIKLALTVGIQNRQSDESLDEGIKIGRQSVCESHRSLQKRAEKMS